MKPSPPRPAHSPGVDATVDSATDPRRAVREAASERVARLILDRVRSGDLAAGERLPSEHELARIFKVSRPTVREAMRGLSLLGVVAVRHGNGVTISPPSVEQVVDSLRLMAMSDGFTVETVFGARRIAEPALARGGCRLADAGTVERRQHHRRCGRRRVRRPRGRRHHRRC